MIKKLHKELIALLICTVQYLQQSYIYINMNLIHNNATVFYKIRGFYEIRFYCAKCLKVKHNQNASELNCNNEELLNKIKINKTIS